MNDEHPNKRDIQRHWFGSLPEETQVEYEDAMIDERFEAAHPTHEDKMRAKRDWRESQ